MTERQAKDAIERVVRLLAKERVRIGLSKKKLAHAAGVDPKTITLIESGQRSPTLYTLLRIGSAMGLDVGHTLEEAINCAAPSPSR